MVNIIIWACLALTFFCPTTWSSEPLRFAQIENASDQRIGAQVLKIAYQRLGISIEIQMLNGKRALLESSRGTLDGEVHRIFKVGIDYPSLIRVPVAIHHIEPSVFSKYLRVDIHGCASLKSYVIGIERGITHAEECTEGMQDIFAVNSSQQLMKVLDKGRVDLIITDKLNGLLLLKEQNITGVKLLFPPLSRRPVYHYLHQQHADLVPKINQVLLAMKEEGLMAKIKDEIINKMLMEFNHMPTTNN